jgi:hypothetical protein
LTNGQYPEDTSYLTRPSGHGRRVNASRGLDHHLHTQEETLPTSSTNPPRRRSRARRLRLAPPPPSPPGQHAEVAQALLGPAQPPIDNIITDCLGLEDVGQLAGDPRYLMGRLAQALTMLLNGDVPPMNAAEELLTQAIADAQAYRRQRCPRCSNEGICATCRPNWDQAARYEWLWNELGLVSQRPRRPDLRDVSR